MVWCVRVKFLSQDLVFCRELSLEEAARRPLLTGRRVYQSVDPSELYPHVYDALAKAKLTSAFVADSKVSYGQHVSEQYQNTLMSGSTCIRTLSCQGQLGSACIDMRTRHWLQSA